MFGFLRGPRCDATYRQLYAGLCAFQHRQYGLESLPLLSYEAVFLYVLAADCGRCAWPEPWCAGCCRLRTRGRRLHPVDCEIAEFCSSFGLLLASIKLEDDIRDDRSWWARLALWRLKSRIERVYDYFTAMDSCFRSKVRDLIGQHLSLERSHRPMTLVEYCEPTAAAFGYLFALYAQVIQHSTAPEDIEMIGREVGRAIVSFDCAVDWRRDRRHGRYNPLTSVEDCQQAQLTSQRALSKAMWQCSTIAGGESRAARIARATFDRVGDYRFDGASEPTARHSRRMHPRQGDCDIPCDGPGCDACGDCHGCDVPSGPDGSCCFTCFDCGTCCEPGCGRKHRTPQPRQRPLNPQPHQTLIGKMGVTMGPLNPSGMIQIDGKQMPARSQHGWIDADTKVVVLKEQAFGVVVRPQESSDL